MPTFNLEKINKLKKIDRLFRSVYLRPKNNKAYPPIDKNEVKEIIVIAFFLIGDTIMYQPAIKVLKRNFPNARFTMVCEKATEIVLKHQGLVDDFVIVNCPWIVATDYSAKNVKAFFSSIRVINRKTYDVAIDFRGDWRNIFFMNRIKAKRKIDYNFSGGEYMLTDPIAGDPSIVHFTEEAFYLLEQIGCYFTEDDKRPVLTLSADDKVIINQFKADNNLNGKFLIGVHPGTSQEVKRWDEKKYAELLVRLTNAYDNCAVVIYEGPNERATVAAIEAGLAAHAIDHVVVNKTLAEYIRLLGISELMICNDSGAAHIAGAYGIPIVVIFGNVDPKYVTPYGPKIKKIISHSMECKPCYQSFCKFGNNLCIAGVGVDEVYGPVVEIMDIIKPNK